MCSKTKELEIELQVPLYNSQQEPLGTIDKVLKFSPSTCTFKKITDIVVDRLGSYLPVSVSEDVEAGDMGHCLCDTVKPILILSRLAGLIPLTIHHPKGTNGLHTGSCELNFRYKSLATFSSTILIIGFSGFLPFAFVEIKNHMQSVFNGTDLYAFTLQTFAMVVETTILLLAGRLFQCKFTEGWAALNQVYHAMCDAADDLNKIKVGSYIASVVIILELGVSYILNVKISHSSGFGYKGCVANLFWTFVINLTLFIPFILSTVFLFICLLIRSHFLKISEMLASVVKKPSMPSFHQKIDSLRVLHEQCCQAVKYFEDFFGFQILLTLCTCCFTVVIGAYATIVQSEGISSSELSGAWATQMYGAAIFIILILVSGQLVTNSALSPAPVLNSLSFTDLDEKSQTQIRAFLQKISAFPTKLTAVKTVNISTTFLASAATNITTYLLVLMQFKLSLENKSLNNGNIFKNVSAQDFQNYSIN